MTPLERMIQLWEGIAELHRERAEDVRLDVFERRLESTLMFNARKTAEMMRGYGLILESDAYKRCGD